MLSHDEIQRLKSNYDIVDYINQFVPLKKQGADHVAKCPFHDERTESFKVNRASQFFKCFGCGIGGDIIHFIENYQRVSFNDAVGVLTGKTQYLTGNYQLIPPVPIKPTSAFQVPEFDDPGPIYPVPKNAPPPPFDRDDMAAFIEQYPFTDINGTLMCYSVRYADKKGKKQVRPLTFRFPGLWRWAGMGDHRPIYNAMSLAKYPNDPVLIVEGEKTCNAGVANLQQPVISWHGGVEAVLKTDWSYLTGRDVLLLPDNDFSHTYGKNHPLAGQVMPTEKQPGIRCMLELYEHLKPIAKTIQWVTPLRGTPCGWDIADKSWGTDELNQFIKLNTCTVPFQDAPPPPVVPPVSPYVAPGMPHEKPPFTFLGFKKDGEYLKYCFYSGLSKTVISLSNSSITKQNILSLAPLNWWEDIFGSGKKFMDQVSEYLINGSINAGIFSESRIRGRGAWTDQGKTVLHVGDSLIVDGHRVDLHNLKSKYIYEQGLPLGISITEPLHVSNAGRVLEITNLMNWERPVNAYLLAGWCVIAPVCGALKWRPHAWLTGGAGTGKSWILKFVKELIGDAGYMIEGATTEPGIRGLLRHDAMPIIFDEAEAESVGSQGRIKSILELARAASSENEALVVKGVSGGGGVSASRVRTCVLFGSIGMHLEQQSDRSRVTVLSLKAPDEATRKTRFETLSRIYTQTVDADFVRGLHSRTITMLPTILKNAETFSKAAVAFLGGQRHGDQLGPLLAGAVSLEYDGLVTYDEALRWISEKDWHEERELDSSKDERRLISKLLESIVMVETDINTKVERSIAELCVISSGRYDLVENSEFGISAASAETTLNRWGFKIHRAVSGLYDAKIIIASQHEGIRKILRNTPWSGENHAKILQRIPGSVSYNTIRFGAVTSRGVGIPIEVIE
jgi:putative DNA primase/helicase